MEWSSNNKENDTRTGKTRSIESVFKVKKCLFDPAIENKTSELASPVSLSPPLMSASPMDTEPFQESPYSLFKVRKKKVIHRNSSTATSAQDPINTTPTHKKCANDDSVETQEKRKRSDDPILQSPSVVQIAVQKSMLNPNLIGDFSKPCALPTIKGRHPDLKSISPETVAGILRGNESLSYTLIDCRYPYEFAGGHIKDAHNLYNKDDVEKELLNNIVIKDKSVKQNVLIFYCEFSSERGPNMLRYIRGKDRDLNRDCYPFLYYPELYLIEGGYKAFYTSFKELCEPQEYKTMLDKDCADDLAFYRAKCKTWSRRSKRLKRARSSLVF